MLMPFPGTSLYVSVMSLCFFLGRAGQAVRFSDGGVAMHLGRAACVNDWAVPVLVQVKSQRIRPSSKETSIYSL